MIARILITNNFSHLSSKNAILLLVAASQIKLYVINVISLGFEVLVRQNEHCEDVPFGSGKLWCMFSIFILRFWAITFISIQSELNIETYNKTNTQMTPQHTLRKIKTNTTGFWQEDSVIDEVGLVSSGIISETKGSPGKRGPPGSYHTLINGGEGDRFIFLQNFCILF